MTTLLQENTATSEVASPTARHRVLSFFGSVRGRIASAVIVAAASLVGVLASPLTAGATGYTCPTDGSDPACASISTAQTQGLGDVSLAIGMIVVFALAGFGLAILLRYLKKARGQVA